MSGDRPPHPPSPEFAGRSGDLTSTQREALEWLKARRDGCPHARWPYGFNPPTGRPRLSASMRRALAQRGFVDVQRVSDRHFRYEITDAGRAALSRAGGEHG